MPSGPRTSRLAKCLALGFGAVLAGTPGALAQTGIDLDEWKSAFEMEIGNDSLFGSYLAGRHAVNERDRPGAAEYFNEALGYDPDNRMLLEQTFAYTISAGQFEVARELAPRLIKVAPKNIGANLMLAIMAFEKGDFATARERLASADNGPIARLATGVLEAWIAVAEEDHAGAARALDEAGDNPAFESLKVYHRALIADLAGDVGKAREAWDEALAEGEGALRTVDGYGRFHERLGETREAIEAYDEFIAGLPVHPVILEARARAERGDKPDRLVRNARDGFAETLYTLGASLTQDGGGDLALIYLNFALYMRPDFAVAQYLMADILERQQRLEAAIEVYDSINPAAPLKRQATIRAALALDNLERTDDAKARFDALIAADPSDFSALSSLADVLRFRKRYAEASDYYSRAIALADKGEHGDEWRLHYSRGMTYERLKRWPEAEADFLKALEISEDQPLVLNYLGYSWVDMGIHLDEGVEMIRKAVEQRPNDGFIVDSLGWAYYKLGRFDDAVEELERAVELQAADPVINDHLGDAYWRVGRKDEARFQWSHALEMDPEEEEIEKIRLKLLGGLPDVAPSTGVADDGAPAAPAPDVAKDKRSEIVPPRKVIGIRG